MPPSYDQVGQVAQLAIFTTWSQMIRDGHVTARGLHAIRLRLIHGGEFIPGPDRDQMLVEVNDVIAAQLHVRASDLPGSPLQVPDDPRDIDDPGMIT